MVYRKITRLLAERTERAPGDIKKETTFDELGLDALDMTEILTDLEGEFGISIKTKGSFSAVGDLTDFIEKEIPPE